MRSRRGASQLRKRRHLRGGQSSGHVGSPTTGDGSFRRCAPVPIVSRGLQAVCDIVGKLEGVPLPYSPRSLFRWGPKVPLQTAESQQATHRSRGMPFRQNDHVSHETRGSQRSIIEAPSTGSGRPVASSADERAGLFSEIGWTSTLFRAIRPLRQFVLSGVGPSGSQGGTNKSTVELDRTFALIRPRTALLYLDTSMTPRHVSCMMT